jgi:NAD(P)H-hydrate epimerase
MAGMAALRTGAGLVTVACPKSIQATVAGFAPEMMTESLAETADGSIAMSAFGRVQQLLSGKDAVILGPGISRNAETAEFARKLVAECLVPLVLDADGLNAFDGHYAALKPRADKSLFRVLTPHPGEAARLRGISTKEIQADRVEVAQRISRDTGSCVVLKGSRTIIAGLSGEAWMNMTGNPALAKGGSGDVLSGMIGAALARRSAAGSSSPVFLQDVRTAAAVHLHGLAADFARDELHENTVLATDVMAQFSAAFRECQSQTDLELFYMQR